MEYELQFARLATTEKLPDRFLNTQLKANADLTKVSMGEVLMMIEILTPWFPTAQIGQNIITSFYQSYYDAGSTSDIANFEEALKKVNTTLAQVTQNGETDWIGNLNAVLGVVIENKIHIAQTGKAEVYIFREGKTNHLTEGLVNQSEAHPLKTFSNITSGELKNHDKVLIANPELYAHLDLENLRQLITMNNPNDAITQIAKLLKKKKVNTVNILILNLISTEELAKQPISNEKETVYLDKPLESMWAGVTRTWKNFIYPFVKFIGAKSKDASVKSYTFTKNYMATLKEKRKTNQPVRKRDLFQKEFIENEKPKDSLLNDEEIKYSPELEVHQYKESLSKKDNKFANFLARIGGFLMRAYHGLIVTFQNPKKRPYLYIILAIIIILITVWVINSRHKNTNVGFNLNQAQETLREAEINQKEAKTAQLANDNEKAKLLYWKAIESSKTIMDFPVVGGNAKDIYSNSYVELDKLTNTTRFDSLNKLVTLDDTIKSLYVVSGQIFSLSGNTIFRNLASGGTPEKVTTIAKNSGDYQFGTISGSNIYLYTSAQKLYDFNTETASLEPAKLDGGSWETANSMTAYGSNLYLLDGIIGQIYKHSSKTDAFLAGEAYINSGSIDLKQSNSITIDGDVYVLRETGEVLKFSKGKLLDFSLKDIPIPFSKITKPLKIYTDSDTDSLYILDGDPGRILEFDKDGGYRHQYALPENIGTISDFSVSVKAKKIWLSADKNVYEIGI